MRLRICISAVIGVASAAFCYFLLLHFHQGAGDFGWAVRAAQHRAGRTKSLRHSAGTISADRRGFRIALRLALRPEVAGALFYGISSALLAFGLTRHGYHRLLVFLAYPYWGGLLAVQWSTLIFASAFFPLLLPVTMAKPQLGLPVALTRLSRRGVVACVAVALLTLFAMPRWPLLWLGQLKNYEHFIPAAGSARTVAGPGPVALSRQGCLVSAADRADAATLVLRRLYPVAHSQVAPRDSLHRRPELGSRHLALVSHPAQLCGGGKVTVLFIYLPMLAVILLRQFAREES